MSNNAPVDSPYLTAAEAASYLRYPSVHWFRVSVKKYGIPAIRRGRRVFFTRQALDEFMAVASEATNPKPGRSKKGKAA